MTFGIFLIPKCIHIYNYICNTIFKIIILNIIFIYNNYLYIILVLLQFIDNYNIAYYFYL